MRSDEDLKSGSEGLSVKEVRALFSTAQSAELVMQDGTRISLSKEQMEGVASGKLASETRQKSLTTQQAADLLGVSRPYLIGLLEKGEIPFLLVGRHRRIAQREVEAYGVKMKQARREAFERFCDIAAEMSEWEERGAE